MKIRGYQKEEKNVPWENALQKAVEQVLGKDALNPKKTTLKINSKNLNNLVFLEDFFMNDKEWMEDNQGEEQGI